MLLLLITILLSTETVFLLLKRDRKSFLVFMSALSLFAFIFGILIYIAKKGGITDATSVLLFGPVGIRRWMQYLVMTLGQLGYIVAIGRTLFPLFILLSAFSFSYFPLAMKMKRFWWILSLPSLLTLIVYIPDFFKCFIAPESGAIRSVVYASRSLSYIYVIAASAVMVYEHHSITSSFFKRRFLTKASILISLCVVFALYANQDPAQIYLFYSNDYMWNLGLLYLAPGISDGMYAFVMVISLVASISGCIGTFKYIRVILDDEHEEIELRAKANAASLGVSMFIHGTKNELLSSRILISRIERSGYRSAELDELKGLNEKLLERMERLRSSISRTSVHLEPYSLRSVIEGAEEKARRSQPDIKIDARCDGGIIVLADSDNLSEAISNIAVNGWEANKAQGNHDSISIRVQIERLWVSVTVQDSGGGLPKEAQRHIWEPFFSTKNSSSNWGMGMYFARRIIHMHLGSIRFETKSGVGTRFIILLPRYEIKDGSNE